ncbi:AtuA-related protein [Fictibacillus sp. NRS-1165]|uniref:AtuA-related protein n=1 Tax=Fictibacillus sp. NRS-1165 TaxID=3144463 RepID=UPI003D1B6F5B
MKLKEIAHSRTGDKGNISNVSVIVYEMGDYEKVKNSVTADRVKDYFQEIVKGDVKRYELPKIGALNFVMENALGGGVTRSLAIDRHGKSLSSALMDMEIDLLD